MNGLTDGAVMKRLLAPLALVLLTTSACASSDGGRADGLAGDSMRESQPFRYGNTCTKVFASSYGTASDEMRTPLCLEQQACWDDVPAPKATTIGSSTYHGRTWYEDVVWFEGTCEQHVPVSCDARPRETACASCKYSACCGSVAVCEDDPNCVTLDDCMAACGFDADCATSCRVRGDSVAAKNHSRAMTCVNEWCQDECKQAE